LQFVCDRLVKVACWSVCSVHLLPHERVDVGEVLNCNMYDIATHAAVELAADKFIVMTADDLQVWKLNCPVAASVIVITTSTLGCQAAV
jgi:hypothetical protein